MNTPGEVLEDLAEVVSDSIVDVGARLEQAGDLPAVIGEKIEDFTEWMFG
jgi:hypothetical protein